MSDESDKHDWKNAIALGVMFILICFGFAACDYVSHRIQLETKMFEAEHPSKPVTK